MTLSPSDERGMVSVAAAIFVVTMLLCLAIVIDGAGIWLRRAHLYNSAELAAAAGGRVVAETIAYAASLNYPNPTDEEKRRAANFITASDRAAIEAGTYVLPGGEALRQAVVHEATAYAYANVTGQARRTAAPSVRVVYGAEPTDCAAPGRQEIEVSVGITGTYEPIFKKFLEQLGVPSVAPISATGTYAVTICP